MKNKVEQWIEKNFFQEDDTREHCFIKGFLTGTIVGIIIFGLGTIMI